MDGVFIGGLREAHCAGRQQSRCAIDQGVANVRINGNRGMPSGGVMDRIGLIGAGLVGAAIAERLLNAGYGVVGYDIRPEQTEVLALMGGKAAPGSSSAAAESETLILSVPTSRIAGSVLDKILPQLRPGSLVIDMTTGAPDDAVHFGTLLHARGIDYVDATVGGSSRHVREGDAILICGASEKAFSRCRGIFAQCSRQAFHVGPIGSGTRMKLVMNLVLGLNRAVLAEGLSFARASDLDPAAALEVLRSSVAYSRAMDTKGERMINENFAPEARLSQHLKDVRLIIECGLQWGAQLPLTNVHKHLLEAAEQAGYGGADNSAIIKAYSANQVS
jgi:3-hydroxyisobutyrate dehydrogenase-like beta-hydroxyacid dehydrogenase